MGGTGVGKSTLGNLLLDTNSEFKEFFTIGHGPVSETKKHQVESFQEGNITYQVIDTIGMDDTALSKEEVSEQLTKTITDFDGKIDQVLFVTSGRSIVR
jgi:GTPase SAR1 family protein